VKTSPEAAYGHGALGMALIAAGQPQRGGEELVLAAQMQPSIENLMNLGDALTVNARSFPEAVRIYKLALTQAENPMHRADRSFVVALDAKLARAYVSMGDFENAAISLHAALHAGETLEPLNANLRVVRAFLLWRQGHLPEARKIVLSVLNGAGPAVKADEYLAIYWGNEDEVHEMLSDLRSLGQPA
jgi:tetratricopeptide (TPR) repeat protein